jgi:NTE family protein
MSTTGEPGAAWISAGELTYTPSDEKRLAFTAAVADLTAQLDAATPAFLDPLTGAPCLAADLVLEGGGVKGIALAGAVLALDRAGYRFPRVAGTSAGAIAAALIAAIQRARRPMTMLGTYLERLTFADFMHAAGLEGWFQRAGHLPAEAADAAELLHRLGLYTGDYLFTWLNPILDELGVTTFADLAISVDADPGMDGALKADPSRQFALVVHISDITRGLLVRVPWNAADYGTDPAAFRIADAVRASMSIPFFFEPVRRDSIAATVEVPQWDGTTVVRQFEGGTVTWVDGGMLSNFPIGVFDRTDGEASRWPTIGIKLSAAPTITPPDIPVHNTAQEALRCLHTMTNEWDRYTVDADAARIIFINNNGINATQFDLTTPQQQTLFSAGADAAVTFVIEQAQVGGALRSFRTADLDLRAPAPAPAAEPTRAPTSGT